MNGLSTLVRLALGKNTPFLLAWLLLSLPPLLHFGHGLLSELLTEHTLDYILLPGASIPDCDHDAAADIAADRDAQDDGCQSEGTNTVIDAPGARAQGDLEEGMEVEDDDDSDEETLGKGVMGQCFVGFVEGVRAGEFLLVMHETVLADTA